MVGSELVRLRAAAGQEGNEELLTATRERVQSAGLGQSPGVRGFAAAFVALLALAACGGGGASSTSSEQVQVGLITKTDTNPFLVKMKEGATKEAAAKGAKLQSAAGKFDGDKQAQVTAVENMVAGGVKGILITPSDTKAIIPALDKARKKGVLVIALDTPTDPQSAVDALFATDNMKAGELIGTPHVFEIADRIHIHRLGRRAAVVTPKSHTMPEVVAIMTGAMAA